METPLTNEQKLDEIYQIVRTQERRRMQASLGRIIKWIIILWVVGFIYSQPELVIQKITDTLAPIILDQVNVIMEENKANLMKSMEDILPR